MTRMTAAVKQAMAAALCILQLGSGSVKDRVRDVADGRREAEITNEYYGMPEADAARIEVPEMEEADAPEVVEVRVPECAVCGAEGHTAEACRMATVRASIERGAKGRFSIPEVGVDVALFESSAQSVVDRADSAGLFYALGQNLIADHNYQGFDAIRRCKVGTGACIETEDGSLQLTCTGIARGTNTGRDIILENGSSINGMNRGGYTCYTCNETRSSVTVVFFQ